MTFKKRQINIIFSDKEKTVELKGLRAHAVIATYGGLNGAAQMQLRVWGMRLEQMNEFSSVGTNMTALQSVDVTIIAGNEGETLRQVFGGSLVSSYIDTAAAPEIAFNCVAISGYRLKASPAAANSYFGAQNAEDIIASLAKAGGFEFKTDGRAHAVLQNHYATGSIGDQILSVARAATFPIAIENNTVYIWENTGYRDGVEVTLAPGKGLVGYPGYYEAGFIVRSEFDPNIITGRVCNLQSGLITKANGKFPFQAVTHEISTQLYDGPWFTVARLAPPPYVSVN